MAFAQPVPPKSLLARYRVLSPTAASVRVSPICLGAMNFGDAWKGHMGECNKETSFSILDFFYSQGGNFIDTSVNYQDGESEIILGDWMASRGVRDQMVIATKYSSNFAVDRSNKPLKPGPDGNFIPPNYGGNSTKSLHLAIETSLQSLKTSYVDILYVHWWDHTTSVSELMLSLNDLVRQGKVLYLGVSDAPAWFVAKCNEFARCNGLRGFVVYQGQWSAANRSFERDILSLCEADGMAIAPWGALGSGEFRSAKQEKTEGRKFLYPSQHSKAVSAVLETIAERKGTLITSVALAYVMHKAPYVFPICGGRKIEHLKGNIDALALELTDEEVNEIEGAAPFDLGFPFSFIGASAEKNRFMNLRSNFDYAQGVKPIPASQMTTR